MKKIIQMAVLFLVSVSLIACSSSSPSDDKIKIGVNLELTGAAASYAIPQRNAFELAAEEINANGGLLGKQIELIIYDNEIDATKSVENATKLATSDKVVALLGPATSGVSAPVASVARQYSVVFLSPSATNDTVRIADDGSVNPWAFTAAFTDPFQGGVLANFAANNLNATKLAVLGTNDSDYSKELTKVFIDQVGKNGGEVVATENYTTADVDYSPLLTKLINGPEFDALFIADYAERAGTIIKQAKEMGLDVPILGPDGFEHEDLLKLAGANHLNNIYFSTHFSSLIQDEAAVHFAEAYKAKFGEDAGAFAALAYDSFYILAEAITTAGSTDTQAIRDALASTKGFSGITGTIEFSAENSPIKAATVVELANGVPVKAELIQP